MGSSGQFRFRESLSPFLAIMQADLLSLFRSKLTYGWLVAALFLEVIRVLGSRSGGSTSGVIGAGLSDFILIWSVIIIGLTASAVSSEAGEFTDSIMSKSVTRFDYLLAKFSSRIIYVLTVFGAISAVLIGLSLRLLDNDYQTSGLIYSGTACCTGARHANDAWSCAEHCFTKHDHCHNRTPRRMVLHGALLSDCWTWLSFAQQRCERADKQHPRRMEWRCMGNCRGIRRNLPRSPGNFYGTLLSQRCLKGLLH